MVIASLNVNSLPAHIDEIRLLLHEKNIHILALNETKIDSDYPSDLLKIEGYPYIHTYIHLFDMQVRKMAALKC